MSSYLFDNRIEPSSERLSRLERVCDAATVRCLDTLGIATGWHCLEIGAGGGSSRTGSPKELEAKVPSSSQILSPASSKA